MPKLKARNFIEDLIEEEHSSRDCEEKMTLKIKEGSSSKEAKKNLSSIFDNESTCWDNANTKQE